MTTRLQRDFDAELAELFRRRTEWVRRQIRKPKVGKPPTFARSHVDAAIDLLNDLTEASLIKEHAVQALSDNYDQKLQWHVIRSKGWGAEKKRKSFLAWYAEKGISQNCVYIFWAKQKCRYVGRTLNGKNRPQAHFAKDWFPGVTRIDVYHSQTKRNIPQLECLATHRFKPRYSKIKPSTRKYYSRCPICEIKKLIKADVRAMFRFRR